MNVTKETVTPKKAMEWLKRNINNRPLSQGWIDQLARAMTDKAWRLNGDCIRFNGNGDLIDGQHRLNACVTSGKSFESYVVRGLEHDAFDTIDQGRKRTIGDVFARQGYKHYVTLGSAVRWLWLHETNSLPYRVKGTLRPDQANEILERHPAIHAAVEMARGLCGKQKLIHPGLLAFLYYVTSESDEKKAVAFWNGVVNAEGLTKQSPAKVLHSRLVSNLGSVAKLNVETIAALCIKSWNAFKTGKPVGTLRWSENEDFPTIS